MKFSLFTALVAGAALVQVGASPLRVIVVTSNPGVPTNYHLASSNPNVATIVRPPVMGAKPHGPCTRFREKALEISNAFRKAFGLPQIEPETRVFMPIPEAPKDGRVNILPFPYLGNHIPTFIPVTGGGNDGLIPGGENVGVGHPHHPHHHHKHGHHGHRKCKDKNATLLTRVHTALMSLGRWEGRAVAFVFGCGLGVLLRMFWVLTVISYRLIRGSKEEEPKYTEIIVVEDYEDAPEYTVTPSYTYTDEKADKDQVVADAPSVTK